MTQSFLYIGSTGCRKVLKKALRGEMPPTAFAAGGFTYSATWFRHHLDPAVCRYRAAGHAYGSLDFPVLRRETRDLERIEHGMPQIRDFPIGKLSPHRGDSLQHFLCGLLRSYDVLQNNDCRPLVLHMLRGTSVVLNTRAGPPESRGKFDFDYIVQ